jgi:lysine biosynthesis protein LysW
MVSCPVCEAEIVVDQDDLDEGDTLTCDECGANLAVASVEPLELESLDEEEEEEEALDYDDEDDEDEEEDDEDEDWK